MRLIGGANKNHQEEDFCECFKVFKFEPEYLQRIDPIKYNFIKEVYSSLNHK